MPKTKDISSDSPSSGAREALMQAATELFADHGFHGTSVEEISLRAKANKAMINYYFGGKRGLYDAILSATLKPAAERLKEIREMNLPAEKRVEQFIEVFGEIHKTYPRLSAMVLRETLTPSDHLTDQVFPYFFEILSQVRAILEQGANEGRLRRVDPFLTHLSLMGALTFFFATAPARNMMIQAKKLPFPPPTPDQFLTHLKDLYSHALTTDLKKEK